MKRLALFIFLSTLLCGCHKNYSVNGVVIDKWTGEPIHNVRVALKRIDTTTTDSLGRFEFKKVLTGGYAFSDAEILLEKDSYKTRYINVNKAYKSPSSLNIELERGKNTNSLPREGVKLFYIFKIIISVINFVTILFILFNNVQHKVLWISGIIFINCVFDIIYIDGSTDFDFFHGPFSLLHYIYSPFTITVVIPLVTIAFWVLYLKRKITNK